MPIMYTDNDREERLRHQAIEHDQSVLTPERLLHGRVRDLLATVSLFRAGELATLLGLEAFFEAESSELSAGEQQLVGLGHALSSSPKTLFLSEPFLFLDHVRRKRLMGLLEEIERRFGCQIHCSMTIQSDLSLTSESAETTGRFLNQIENVQHRYPLQTRYALVTGKLSFHQGERIAIVGANGSGKSTLLRLALGVERPLYGKVRRAGEMHYVPAHPMLAPLDDRSGSFTTQKKRLLDGIEWSKDSYYFDEPTAGLDDSARMDFVASWKQNPTNLIVMATHDPVLIRTAQRIIYLVHGEVAFDGPTKHFLQESRLFV
ncbi:ATP-binding cassette domain-containing protein [Exiguobacterium sp. 9-2]|uniref:ATP-binding cassette domain-containing protein n=1 Tax=Exiguobacterium sp. 9-2 TaxID=3112419 RepID=UPI002E351C28|nr:ATP-binding cassette domain-containing protein [Exiguobacterium sp. 9-2]